MDTVCDQLLNGYLLTAAQHYNSKHCFKCSECVREFKSRGLLREVPFHPLYLMAADHLLTVA